MNEKDSKEFDRFAKITRQPKRPSAKTNFTLLCSHLRSSQLLFVVQEVYTRYSNPNSEELISYAFDETNGKSPFDLAATEDLNRINRIAIGASKKVYARIGSCSTSAERVDDR